MVYASDWAHSCVALGQYANVGYWDSGASWGGISLSGGDPKGARLSYVFHRGQPDGSFGRIDHARLTNLPTAKLVQ